VTRCAGRTDPDWACSNGGTEEGFAGQPRANNRDKGNVALFQINDSARFVMYELGIPIFPCRFSPSPPTNACFRGEGESGASVLRRDEVLLIPAGGDLLVGSDDYGELRD
jgi:hypothetical protein